jgi:hypothetical protein
MVKSRRWTKRNGSVYLETFALSPEFVERVWSEALNAADSMANKGRAVLRE